MRARLTPVKNEQNLVVAQLLKKLQRTVILKPGCNADELKQSISEVLSVQSVDVIDLAIFYFSGHAVLQDDQVVWLAASPMCQNSCCDLTVSIYLPKLSNPLPNKSIAPE